MTEKADTLQHIRIDSTDMSEPQMLALFQGFMPPEFSVSALPTTGRQRKALSGGGETWVLDSLSASIDYNINCRLQHRCTDEMAKIARLRVITTGSVHGVVEGETISLRPGDVMVEASNISFLLDLEDFGCQVIGVSVALLGHDLVTDLTHHKIPADAPEAVMIAASMAAFFGGLKSADGEQAEHMGQLLAAILKRQLEMLQKERQHEADRTRGQQMRMLRYIEENLADHALSITDLTEQFPLSRAVIYRMFEEYGGVSHYVSRRRLFRALSYLVFDSFERPIGEIAQAVGFANKAHFSSSFKKQFGVSPSQARDDFSFDRANALEPSQKPKESGLLLRELLNRSQNI
ncbi:helix-turn-helix transcriptional regulator [Alterisphingorhabdus coralli]|uniref:AraC family transcriptional regulator n=1 Tax=Alterisphingorhabdus coralli TaxID=3071408 RepID=A0AA97I0B8_9SPHN|nr:AraC family transcriptional regulator [Parasphingorhabdus sp. SCSIO 66989]WOE75559.1 AraC family transcriptional regulator [Parasphingorhabdus sp. SCSIO 66989]